MNKFLKLYNYIKNPLEDDAVFEEIIKAYIKTRKNHSTTLYDEIVKIGTEEKNSNPPSKEDKDKFWASLFNKWKRNILKNKDKIDNKKYDGHLEEIVSILEETPDIFSFDEMNGILEKNPILAKYGTVQGGRPIWRFLLSSNVNGTKEKDIETNYRLYINTESSDAYQIVAGFIGKCHQQNLPYYLKFIDDPDDYSYRADSLVIWADEKTLIQYIGVLNEMQKENPQLISRCKSPQILTSNISNWVGFAEEPKEGSYTQARMDILNESIKSAIKQWLIENQEKKFMLGNMKFSVKEYIAARSIREEFRNIENTISPQLLAKYGLEKKKLNSQLYVRLFNEIVDEVIPTIERDENIIEYNKDGKNMAFDFDRAINKILDTVMNDNIDKKSLIEKTRENVKLNSMKYGIDEEKFIFNSDYLNKITKSECEHERE